MPSHPHRHAALSLLAVLLAHGIPANAEKRDYADIRRLQSSGEILSLETIIARHRRQHPGGQLLEAELELEQGRYVYDLKILDGDGVVREFEYDARTGELWSLEQKSPRSKRD